MDNTKMKECTFSPQLIHQAERPRTLDEFLQDQSRFQQKRLDNIAKISGDNKEKVKEEIDQHPKIDEYSLAIVQMKPRNEPIYERLYAINKKSIQSGEIQEKATKEKEQSQSLSIRPQERREFHLYEIAVQKNRERLAREEELKQKKANSKPKVASTDPLVVQGFMKEFMNAVANVGLVEGGKVNYKQMSNSACSLTFYSKSTIRIKIHKND